MCIRDSYKVADHLNAGEIMKLKAYAKLNLALNIIGQYPNGMHELDMLMQTISLADELTVVRADGLEPVSYTHLDVYKRQCRCRWRAAGT